MACSADAHPPLSSATLSLPSELMGAVGGSAWAEQRGRPLSEASLATAAARCPVLRQQGRSAGTWGQVGPTGLLPSRKAHILFSPEETLALAMCSPSLSTCLRQDCHLWLAERFILSCSPRSAASEQGAHFSAKKGDSGPAGGTPCSRGPHGPEAAGPTEQWNGLLRTQ